MKPQWSALLIPLLIGCATTKPKIESKKEHAEVHKKENKPLPNVQEQSRPPKKIVRTPFKSKPILKENPKPLSPKVVSKPRSVRKKQTPRPVPQSSIPKELMEVEATYSKSDTINAKFRKSNFYALLDETKNESGHFSFKRPNQFRWETQSPEEETLVSDGRTFWKYTPGFNKEDRGSVMIGNVSQIQSEFASALLSGRFSKASGVKISKIDSKTFSLIPKRGSAGTVVRADILINPSTHLIETVKLIHSNQNISTIDLNSVELGKHIPNQNFKFKIPPHTDVIKN